MVPLQLKYHILIDRQHCGRLVASITRDIHYLSLISLVIQTPSSGKSMN